MIDIVKKRRKKPKKHIIPEEVKHKEPEDPNTVEIEYKREGSLQPPKETPKQIWGQPKCMLYE